MLVTEECCQSNKVSPYSHEDDYVWLVSVRRLRLSITWTDSEQFCARLMRFTTWCWLWTALNPAACRMPNEEAARRGGGGGGGELAGRGGGGGSGNSLTDGFLQLLMTVGGLSETDSGINDWGRCSTLTDVLEAAVASPPVAGVCCPMISSRSKWCESVANFLLLLCSVRILLEAECFNSI